MREPVALVRPQHYSQAIASVWRELELALARLDDLAAQPFLLLEHERAARLSPLQYRLHAASEAVLALAPPAEAEDAHRDLADALVVAREATAAIATALEANEPTIGLVYEWRGALFRVRLARLDLVEREAAPPAQARFTRLPWARIQGVLLLVAAVGAIAIGAHMSAWFVVTGGALAALLGVSLLLRP
jgi:hypothetical protein